MNVLYWLLDKFIMPLFYRYRRDCTHYNFKGGKCNFPGMVDLCDITTCPLAKWRY